jgi:hypothetical protein
LISLNNTDQELEKVFSELEDFVASNLCKYTAASTKLTSVLADCSAHRVKLHKYKLDKVKGKGSREKFFNQLLTPTGKMSKKLSALITFKRLSAVKPKARSEASRQNFRILIYHAKLRFPL